MTDEDMSSLKEKRTRVVRKPTQVSEQHESLHEGVNLSNGITSFKLVG